MQFNLNLPHYWGHHHRHSNSLQRVFVKFQFPRAPLLHAVPLKRNRNRSHHSRASIFRYGLLTFEQRRQAQCNARFVVTDVQRNSSSNVDPQAIVRLTRNILGASQGLEYNDDTRTPKYCVHSVHG